MVIVQWQTHALTNILNMAPFVWNSPLGFDMEWAITWRKGGCSDRRTAVVQLCDKRMILVIQLSEMSSMFLDFPLMSLSNTLCRVSEERQGALVGVIPKTRC